MKRTPPSRPDWLETCAIMHKSESLIAFPMVQDLASLLWIVNLGCIDLNQWYARCDDIDRPDYLHFDLDPGAGRAVRRRCARPRSWCATRSSRLGMPRWSRPAARAGCICMCRSCAGPLQKEVWRFAKRWRSNWSSAHPKLITAEYRIAKRPARARPGGLQPERVGSHAGLGLFGPAPAAATVSTPVTWTEVERGCRDRGLPPRQRPGARAPSWATCGSRSSRPAAGSGSRSVLVSLPLESPYPPMEADSRRCAAGRGADGSTSPSGTASAASPFAMATRCASSRKAGQPLGRYFPDVVAALAALRRHAASCWTARS